MRNRLMIPILLFIIALWTTWGIAYASDAQDSEKPQIGYDNPSSPSPQVVPPLYDFNNFSDVSIFNFNGDATQANDGSQDVIRLTPTGVGRVGSAFVSTPIPISLNTSFQTFFEFRFHPGTGADGMYFVLHNDPNGSNALGGDGSGMGYTFNNGGGPNCQNCRCQRRQWYHNPQIAAPQLLPRRLRW